MFQNTKYQNVHQILCCGYSLESSQSDDSNEYPQHRIRKRSNESKIPSLPTIWTSDPVQTFSKLSGFSQCPGEQIHNTAHIKSCH